MLVRLQKYIADAGICSRRKAEELIRLGDVKVNDTIVKELGTKVDPKKDVVEVQGKRLGVRGERSKIYIALNKPVDYITSTTSEQGMSVMDLLTTQNCIKKQINQLTNKQINSRLYPVGRLDKDSEGLVLLTNDGELANKLTHPRYEHEKEYEITITNKLSKDAIKVLESGMSIGDENVGGIKIKKVFNKGKRQIVTTILKEGKSRQIRKMFGRLGYNVISLRRVRMGKLTLGTLPVGRWRFVTKEMII